MEEEEEDARYEFEERDGRRLKFFAGEPGNYVGVTEYKFKRGTLYYARASTHQAQGRRTATISYQTRQWEFV